MKSNYYFTRLAIWIYEGKFIYSFILLFVIPYIIIRIGLGDTALRLFGLSLQIIGIIPLAMSLREKSLLFGKATFFKSLLNYLKRIPRKGKTKTMTASVSEAALAIEALDARVRISPKEDFQEIIKYIDQEVEILDDRLTKEIRKTNDNIQKLTETIDSAKQLMNQNINTLERKVILANVSDISRDYFGIFTLVYGLILATIPDLIINFFA